MDIAVPSEIGMERADPIGSLPVPITHGPASQSSRPDEAILIEAVKAGDALAFETLVKRYGSRIHGHCLRLVHDEESSADLSQEVLLRIFRNIHRYQHNFAFYTWVYRITTNCCIDYLRKRQRQINDLAAPLEDDRDSEWPEWESRIPSTLRGPEDVYAGMEMRQTIQGTLNDLPPSLREVIVLRDVEGYSYQEIAGMLTCSTGTVKSRLFRARSRMKDRLGSLLD
jgi:RNA polymerase sigma-70 factor (ECF subfamily)